MFATPFQNYQYSLIKVEIHVNMMYLASCNSCFGYLLLFMKTKIAVIHHIKLNLVLY